MATFWLKYRILIYLFVLPFIIACSTKQETSEKEEALEALQFMSRMNSYPNNDVPADAFGKAYDYFIQHYKNTAAKNTSSLLPWNNIGPSNNGGRTISIAIDPIDTNVVWLGSASGGLWKTTVGGIGPNAWQPVETGFPVLGVSSIAINPQNHNEIFIGTGETYSYGTAYNGLIIRTTRGSHGIGILKTTNGGLTWTHSLNWLYQQQRGVWKIVYNYQNTNTLLAATTDGIYKSFDSGASWFQTDSTKMAMDLVMDPTDTNIVYAGIGNLGTAGTGVYKSTDAGSTWVQLVNGLPVINTGRTCIAINPLNPSVVLAHIADDLISNGLYKSTNKGLSWTLLNGNDFASYQGWYSKCLLFSQADTNTIYVGGVYGFKSVDGGANFNQITTYNPNNLADEPWPDLHDLVVNPSDPTKLYLLTDAGLYRSNNGGQNWRSCLDGYRVAQFYLGSVSQSNANIALAGAQDHGTQRYNGTSEWEWVLGGDGTCNGIDKLNDFEQYASYQNLNLRGSTDQGLTFFNSVFSDTGAFVSPFEIAPSNQNIMYAGSSFLSRSDDKGFTWNSFGPYGNSKILSIGISTTNPLKVYFASAPTSTDSMKFYVSINGGASVTDISAGLPNRYPRDIAVNPNNDNELFAVFSGFGSGHVFYSSNAGQTWMDISGTLPDVPFHSILFYSQVLIAGSDLGVFYSSDTGTVWQHAGNGVPDALQVFDLEYSPADQNLVAFTHGRGVYKTPIAPFLTGIKKATESSANFELKYDAISKLLSVSNTFHEAVWIKIYDAKDRVVISQTLEGKKLLLLNAAAWSSGVYLTQIGSPKSTATKRIVIY
ncbi:MAG: T9SS type A sorting domain-containing protein [Bacteroidetes bacterium]|nr:T9SS type A sorting domain-containing protein [Bacteroidota bacterium]